MGGGDLAERAFGHDGEHPGAGRWLRARSRVSISCFPALAQRSGQPRRLVLAPPLAVVHALDINDGVRINIHPFMAHDIPAGKKGLAMLRVKRNVHRKKERGKGSMREQSQYHWSWRSGKFTGGQSNDLYFIVANKDGARDRAKE